MVVRKYTIKNKSDSQDACRAVACEPSGGETLL